MLRVFLFSIEFGFIISLANCDQKLSPSGEIIGPLGPTIVEKPSKPDDDAKTLKSAVDSDSIGPIADLISKRTLAQRLQIDKAYAKISKDGVNITSSIRSAILNSKHDGDTMRFYRGFFLELPRYLAVVFYNSIVEIKDWVHLSIVCTRSATFLKALRDGYVKEYGVEIETDIDAHAQSDGNDVLKLMLNLKSMRPDNGTDDKQVDKQVALIPGNKDACNSQDLLNFMASTSFDQINKVVTKWKANNKNVDLVENFRQNCNKGYRQETYKRIVRFAMGRYQYYSEEFKVGYNQVSGALRAHQYIVTSRCEIDLKDIIKRYNDDNNKADLINEVKGQGDDAYHKLFYNVLVGNA